MDKEDLIRNLDRALKIRALQVFEETECSMSDLEREFALEALDLMRRQPLMAEAADVPLWGLYGRSEDEEPAVWS